MKKGQLIAESADGRGLPVHSPTSGKVAEIGNYPHPIYGSSLCVVVESDGLDEWQENLLTERNYENHSRSGNDRYHL